MDGGVWWAAVHGVTKSYTTEWLHFHFSLSCIWEGNGNPLQGLFWRIPGMGEPGGLLSMGSHRVGHNWSDLAAAAAVSHGKPSASHFRQFSSISQSRLTFCDPMNHSTPGLPVHNQLLESNKIHVHWVGDCHPTISSSVLPFSSHPQTFPASGSFQMSQFFASVGQSIGESASTSVLPMIILDWLPLGQTGWISLLPKGLSRVFSNTIVQKHQFFIAQLSLQSNSHNHTWLLEKPQPWQDRPLLAK